MVDVVSSPEAQHADHSSSTQCMGQSRWLQASYRFQREVSRHLTSSPHVCGRSLRAVQGKLGVPVAQKRQFLELPVWACRLPGAGALWSGQAGHRELHQAGPGHA